MLYFDEKTSTIEYREDSDTDDYGLSFLPAGEVDPGDCNHGYQTAISVYPYFKPMPKSECYLCTPRKEIECEHGFIVGLEGNPPNYANCPVHRRQKAELEKELKAQAARAKYCENMTDYLALSVKD